MPFLKQRVALLLVLTGSASLAFARQANEAELEMLGETVRTFQCVTEKVDVNTLVDQILSPRLI